MARRRLLPPAVFALAAIAVGGVAAIAPAAAQKVDNSNVTQVRIPCPGPWVGCSTGLYSKVQGSKKKEPRWVERENKVKRGAGSRHYVETKDGAPIALKGVEWVERVRINLGGMQFARGIRNGSGPGGTEGYYQLDSGSITSVYGVSSEGANDTCRDEKEPGVKCDCDLTKLRPLQGAVGMEEVNDKAKKIENDEKGERRDLAYDPIKLVRGPNQDLFITDHHHGARAWRVANKKRGTCTLQEILPTGEKEFRAELEQRNLVHLADENGKAITWEQLPKTLEELKDDPYRTLAWKVRKANGFCRAFMTSGTEFAEFKWGDWMRANWAGWKAKNVVAVAYDPKNLDGMLPDALKRATSADAGPQGAGLPGWRAELPKDKEKTFQCPPDPVE